MKPKNEELLYFLLWTADAFLCPTWRNLNDSFETWSWRNGLGRRLAVLERQRLIERHPDADLRRVVRLTEAGKRLALGGRDPAERWGRSWDGRWRFVLFDIPDRHSHLRLRLRRVLRGRHFGYLQNSIWVSPDPTADVRMVLGDDQVQADAFLVVEGTPAAGESDAEIVTGAWDFGAINQGYERYLSLGRTVPDAGARLIAWTRRENSAWTAALRADPLLPASLLPAGYRGREAFQRRKEILARLAVLPQHRLPDGEH